MSAQSTKARTTSFKPPAALALIGLIVFVGAAAAGKLGVGVIGVVLLLAGIGWMLTEQKDRTLRAAPSGATRIETVKQQAVNRVVKQYSAAGWTVAAQSSAKSFGSQARITVTFRKP